MAFRGTSSTKTFFLICVISTLVQSYFCSGRKLASLVNTPPPDLLTYHDGTLLRGDIPVSILWYGKFTPAQKSVVSDFLISLGTTTPPGPASSPSVSDWWKTLEDMYFRKSGPRRETSTRILVADQYSDEKCSIGKSLKKSDVPSLAARANAKKGGGIALVLTAEDVTVEGFCMSGCGSHGSVVAPRRTDEPTAAYIWVGNSASQCPGQCAWPFHQPIYGPQSPPLVPPNGDVGIDGMVINLASLLAGTATNPFGNGYFQGPKEAPLEAASACPGVYGKGAYPGYAGELLVDSATGGSYNAHGANGRKYLLPALLNPSTSSCSTLV